MGKFNVHGGTFAPKGFFRVNEGGSHESNPNGGVQVGMDEQGIPNMLEENEPVYKDFVYSDRIAADAAVLEQFNIPAKFAGKLYSEIADAYVDEAEERPDDPVSNNGLNAMLVRLAKAQEAQKQKEEEAELQKEIEQMSPEELEMLDQMLAGEEQTPVVEQPVEEVPVMALGGPMNQYGNGSPESNTALRAASIIAAAQAEKNEQLLAQQELQAKEDAAKKSKAEIAAAKRRFERMQKYVIRDEKKLDKLSLNAVNVHPAETANYQRLLESQIKLVDYNKGRLAKAKEDYEKLVKPVQTNDVDLSFDDEPQTTGAKVTTVKGFEWLDDFARKNNLKGCGGKIRKFPLGGYKPNYKIDLLHPETTPRNGAQALASKMDLRNPAPAKKIPELLWNRSSNRSTVNKTSVEDTSESTTLPTWPMYAGILGNAAISLYDAFQPVDEYSFRTLQAQEPEGRMRQQHFRYNPIPITLLQDPVAQQARGNVRAALASEAGPSTGSLLVALDKNYTSAVGDALLKGIQADNQAYNESVAHNNEADARQAMFDYQVDAAKKRAREEVDRINAMYDMRRQVMNNEAEQAKYTALQVPLDNMLEGLAGIGRQNFAMNQVNSNPALLYGVYPKGVGFYKRAACGGKLIKSYKK